LVCAFAAGPVDQTVAEPSQYYIHHWLREDGLPQNTVTAVLQTRDGYIWIGSYNGLSCFDGDHFTVFEAGSTPGLASSRVTSLFEDDKGVLWIGHEGGKLTRYQAGKFESCPLTPARRRGNIIGIVSDGYGDIWLQNDEGRLSRERDGLVLTPEPGVYGGICQLARNKQGTIWVGRNGRISVLDHDRLTPLPIADGNTNTSFIGIGAARDGGLWLVTTNQLREWKDGNWTKDRGVPPFQGAPMLKLLENRDGTLIGASSDHGFALVRPDRTVSKFSRATVFTSDWVIALCVDREGGVWVGTGGAGLALVRECNVQTLAPPDAWQGRAVLSVCADHEGALWVGTEGVGLYRFQNHIWTNFGYPSGVQNPYVWSIAEDNSGNLWAGTWNAGLFVRHGQHFDPAPGLERIAGAMPALLPARAGGLWIGTADGLLRYNSSGKYSWLGRQEGSTNNDVRCIIETHDGTIWFGTTGEGLFRVQDGVLKSFRKADGLPTDFIQCLREDENGAIWVGTFGGGVCRIKGGHFATIGKAQGLADNVICDIEDDEHGHFWMSSYDGIIRVNKDALNQCADGLTNSLVCGTYGISDGMPTLECSCGLQPAGCKMADGRMLFATSRGLVIVDPLAVKNNPLPPPVVIEKLVIDGEEVAAGPDFVDRVNVPPGRHRVEIQYAGLSFAAPEKVRFHYRLTGLDSDWIDAGTKRAAEYDYIPPGDYTFQVIACNNDGVWNEKGAALAFVMLPYFWQTAWFRVMSLVALVLVTGGGAWYGTRRRMRAKLERIERQRALERERTRIAKDIHDDLGASLTRINLLSQTVRRDLIHDQRSSRNLDQICTTARQLTRAMDEIVWAVDPQHDTLDSLASYLGKLIHELLADSDIRCRLDFPVHLPAWPVNAEVRHNLFLACKECLHNVLKHSGATEVQVSFTLAPEAFTVTIVDNGCGFELVTTEGQPRSHHNGLVNMRQRLQEINGRCEIQSQSGQGTKVTFFLSAKETVK
jgi:signal transduction histidine kinase/ligand-binding sensor domain-containing protein